LIGFSGRLELITTIARLKRIPLLALFFVSAMEFILERAFIDLVLMSGAITILLWGGVWRPRHIHTPSRRSADNSSKVQNPRPEGM
jgi:hypothetical protein